MPNITSELKPHVQPPVNICADGEGRHRIEVFGETVCDELSFKVACETYNVFRLAATLADGLLAKTLRGA